MSDLKEMIQSLTVTEHIPEKHDELVPSTKPTRLFKSKAQPDDLAPLQSYKISQDSLAHRIQIQSDAGKAVGSKTSYATSLASKSL